MNSSPALKLADAGGRYFGNPFLTNSAEGAAVVSREWILQNLQTLSKKITSHKISADEYQKEDGPYVGPSGIAYSLFRAMKANPQLELRDCVKAILSKQMRSGEVIMIGAICCCIWRIKKMGVRLGDYLHFFQEASESHECRYLSGTLGYYTIQTITDAFFSKHSDISSISTRFRKMIDIVVQPNYQKRGDDEMLNGRAGFLAALLEIRLHLGKFILSDDEIRKVLNAMITSGRNYSKRHKSHANLMYEWHDSEYLGAAHGISGIYQMLLSFWNLLDESSKSDLKQSVDWLLSIQLADGNYPSRTGKKEEDKVHWCHGAPGVLHMLIVAYLMFNEAKYMEAAKKCADLIWTKGILHKGPGICHGVAGNGYAFLFLYRLIHNEEYLNKAKAFARVMLDQSFINSARTPDRPWSLFEGWSGALCFLADLLNPAEAQFPLIPICFK